MKLSIGKFLIESDSCQFTLYQIGKSGAKAKNPGSEKRIFVGHYPSLKTCLECFPDRALMLSEADGVNQVLDELKNYQVEIKKALKGA